MNADTHMQVCANNWRAVVVDGLLQPGSTLPSPPACKQSDQREARPLQKLFVFWSSARIWAENMWRGTAAAFWVGWKSAVESKVSTDEARIYKQTRMMEERKSFHHLILKLKMIFTKIILSICAAPGFPSHPDPCSQCACVVFLCVCAVDSHCVLASSESPTLLLPPWHHTHAPPPWQPTPTESVSVLRGGGKKWNLIFKGLEHP